MLEGVIGQLEADGGFNQATHGGLAILKAAKEIFLLQLDPTHQANLP